MQASWGVPSFWSLFCGLHYILIVFLFSPNTYTIEDRLSKMNSVEVALDVYRHLTGFRFVAYTGSNSDYGLTHNNYLNFKYYGQTK